MSRGDGKILSFDSGCYEAMVAKERSVIYNNTTENISLFETSSFLCAFPASFADIHSLSIYTTFKG